MNVKGNGVGNIVVYYYYDNDGNVVSMSKNGTIYHYLKNLQGDIIGINDSANNTVVSYSYDMFGKTTNISDTSSQNLSTLNPFRFRGYIFDHETGFYYLNSRYYDPETGRFINADIYCDTGTNIFGTNMYAYSNNNYVNQVDPEGTDAYWVQFGFGAKGFGHTSVLLQDTVNNWWYFYWSGKQVILRNCGKDRFKNHSELNCYLCGFDPRNHHCHYVFTNNVVHDSEEVQNIYGEKYRLKAHDKQITDWILFMGDFSNSYTYLQNLCNKLFFNSNATQLFTYVREKNKDVLMYQVVSEAYDKPFYAWLLGLNFYCKYYKDIKVNNDEVKQYDLFNNNCLHVSLDALLNGSFIYSNERDILKDIRKDEFIPNKAYNKLFEKTFI